MNQQIPEWVQTYTVGRHERIYPVIGQPVPIQAYKPQLPDVSRSPQVRVRLGIEEERRLTAGQRFVVWLNKK